MRTGQPTRVSVSANKGRPSLMSAHEHKREQASAHKSTRARTKAGQCTRAHPSATREAPERWAYEGKYKGTDEGTDESRGEGNDGVNTGTVSPQCCPHSLTTCEYRPATRAPIQRWMHRCRPRIPSGTCSHARRRLAALTMFASRNYEHKPNGRFAGHVRVVIVVVVEQVRSVLIHMLPLLCSSSPCILL
jgi:hypothetical protein